MILIQPRNSVCRSLHNLRSLKKNGSPLKVVAELWTGEKGLKNYARNY